jgi:branched-chain amino acid transport system substrate-binding protein
MGIGNQWRPPTRWAFLIALLAIALPALAGCGGGGSSSESNVGSTGEAEGGSTKEVSEGSTSTASGSPLRVAVLADITGPVLSGEERAPAVLEAWVRHQNKEGGVAGHPVELVIEDTKGEPTAAAAAAEKVTNEKAVVAAISFDANAESVYAKKLVAAHIPVIGGMGFSPEIWGALPNWFSVTTNFPAVINSAMVLAKETGAKKASYVVCAEVATCEAIGGIAEGATGALGLEYGGTIKISAATPDYTAECLSLEEKGVEFAALGHSAEVDLRFAKDCRTQGYEGHFGMTSGSIEPEVMKQNDPGAPIDLALNAFPWYATEGPAVGYRELMEAEGVSEDDWADPHGTAAYATMELFKATLEGDPTLPAKPTRQDIIAAYGMVKNQTLEGLVPQPLTFTANKPAPLVSCYWFGKFDAGQFTGAGLEEPSCDPPALTKQG